MSQTELSSTGLLPDGSQQLDINGRPITPRRRRRGMAVNALCAGLGTLFAVIYWPGSGLFSMYMQERLGATTFQIGAFSAIVGVGQVAQLLGVYIFDRTRTRKRLWVTLVLAYRFLTFGTVGFAIYAHLDGASPMLVWSMLALLGLGFSMAQLSANAWWSWMADLAPRQVRGRFLGNRQLAATVAILLGTLPVILLDTCGKDAAGDYTAVADYIFIGIFILCTTSGIIDVIIHAYIPEPARLDRPDATSLKDTVNNLLQPLRDHSFRRFTLAMTLGSFSLMFWSPFVWPYLKSREFIDVAYWVYFAAIALHCFGMFVGSRYWGILIDRFGSKPVTAITYCAGFLSVYLLFITPQNAVWLVLVAGGLLSGLMWSGMMLSSAQLMLTLSPKRTRNSYVATHAAVTGMALILGAMCGGALADAVKPHFYPMPDWPQVSAKAAACAAIHARHTMQADPGAAAAAATTAGAVQAWFQSVPPRYRLWTGTVFTHMQFLILIGLVLRLAVYPLILRIREGNEKPIGMVLGTVFAASQFRTLHGMRLFVGRSIPKRINAIRRMGADSDQLAVNDLIDQLDDAEPEIRREAALALGRIGGPEAVKALVALLNTPESDAQPEAARALGMAGDQEAIKPLVGKLTDPNEIIREHAAGALGELRSREAAGALMELLKKDPSPRVSGRGALALAKLGVMDAIWEILPMMHQTSNVALRRQLATAVGNLLGKPAQFYHLLNGELRSPGSQVVRAVKETRRRLRNRARRIAAGIQTVQAEQVLVAARHVGLAMDAFEIQQYDQAIEQLHVAAMEILRAVYGFTEEDDVAVEFALSRSGFFGVGLWFLQVANQYAKSRDSRDELLRLDAMLGFHFIHSFADSLQ